MKYYLGFLVAGLAMVVVMYAELHLEVRAMQWSVPLIFGLVPLVAEWLSWKPIGWRWMRALAVLLSVAVFSGALFVADEAARVPVAVIAAVLLLPAMALVLSLGPEPERAVGDRSAAPE